MTDERALEVIPELDDQTLETFTRHGNANVKEAAQAELDRRAGNSVVPVAPNFEHSRLCHITVLEFAEDLELAFEKIHKTVEREAEKLMKNWIPAFRFMQDPQAEPVLAEELLRLQDLGPDSHSQRNQMQDPRTPLQPTNEPAGTRPRC